MKGGFRDILTIPLGPSTAAVAYGRFVDKDGKQNTVAGGPVVGISVGSRHQDSSRAVRNAFLA